MGRLLRLAAAGAALAVLGAGVILLSAQRRLLYFPAREERAGAERAAAAAGLAPWPAAAAFQGWSAAPPRGPAAARAIVLHGNAGSARSRTYLRDVLRGEGVPPLEVILLEYPGYGPRAGAPAQDAILAAALEAIDLAARDGLPVLLVGESLGTAVAALAAAERPRAVRGLLLVTPLSSVAALARRHYGVPGFLVVDRWDAARALPRFGGPAAFLVAGRDEVVFPDLGLALHAAYPGPKRLWVEPGASHDGFPYDPADPRWAELVRFLLAPAAP